MSFNPHGHIQVTLERIGLLFFRESSSSITLFISDESGVVTIDWTVIGAALVAMGFALTAIVSNTLGDYSGNVRGELQDPHFNTDWFDNVAVLPPSLQQ